MMRTDSHRNPTAFTTDIARQAGLVEGTDFTKGDPFGTGPNGPTFYTARIIGDPIQQTCRVINALGFYNKTGAQRWSYIAMPIEVWLNCGADLKIAIIGGMYHREGGTEMKNLFPHPLIF